MNDVELKMHILESIVEQGIYLTDKEREAACPPISIPAVTRVRLLREVQEYIKSADEVKRLRRALSIALAALEAAAQDDVCEFDHHGDCQTHWGGGFTDPDDCYAPIGREAIATIKALNIPL